MEATDNKYQLSDFFNETETLTISKAAWISSFLDSTQWLFESERDYIKTGNLPIKFTT